MLRTIFSPICNTNTLTFYRPSAAAIRRNGFKRQTHRSDHSPDGRFLHGADIRESRIFRRTGNKMHSPGRFRFVQFRSFGGHHRTFRCGEIIADERAQRVQVSNDRNAILHEHKVISITAFQSERTRGHNPGQQRKR